jgi:hypothetical protein
VCLRQSAGFALASWGIGCAPTFVVRRLGWSYCRPFYQEVLFSNWYTSAASVILPLFLAGVTVIFQGTEQIFIPLSLPGKENPKLKKELWAASCLSAGTVVAPLFFQPRDILSIVGFASALFFLTF